MKKLYKRIITAMLALVIFVSTFLGVGQEAKAAATTTAVTWGIVEVLEAIFATFGIAILTDSMLNTTGWTDGSSALDDDWQDIYDSMEEEYENQRIYLYGGGGNEPESGDDNNNDEKPPHFDEIINTALSKKSLELSKEAYNCMNGWIDKYIQKSYELGEIICDKTYKDAFEDVPIEKINGSTVAIVSGKGITVYTSSTRLTTSIIYKDSNNSPICFYDNYLCYFSDGNDCVLSSYNNYSTGSSYGVFSGFVNSYSIGVEDKMYTKCIQRATDIIAYCPKFSTLDEAKEYMAAHYNNLDSSLENKKIALSKLQKESYDKTGKIEYPNAPTFSPNLPSLDTLQELAKQLNNAANADSRADLVEDYLEQLKPSVVPGPSPNPDPSPSPDPDPLPDPDTPSNPDTGDSDNPDDYTADLTQIFPFCIPFDLIHAFNVLNVPGEAPVFDIPFKLDYGSVHIDEHWTIDFSDFETVVQIFRVMETLGFIVGLILVTRALIKG